MIMRWCGESYNRVFANMTLWAYLRHNSHVLVSRSELIVGQEVYFSHVHCGRGFSCPSDCLVLIIFEVLTFFLANGCNTSLAVAKYLDLQQKKKTKTLKNVAARKSTRRVRVGWKHLVKAGRYKVMTLKEGGGQQVVDLDKDMSLYEATKQIVDIYFPGGKSLLCSLSDINFHLASFSNEPILGSSARTTVGDYFESVKSHPVRWYLHTKMKVCTLTKMITIDIVKFLITGTIFSEK